MSRFEDDYDEHMPGGGWLFAKTLHWGLGGMAVLVVLLTAWFVIKPALIKMEGRSQVAAAEVDRDVAKHSHQYVESKRAMLLIWLVDHEYAKVEIEELKILYGNDSSLVTAMESQNATLADRIKTEAQNLDRGELPASVRTFLEENL
jgi:hypothetical protein